MTATNLLNLLRSLLGRHRYKSVRERWREGGREREASVKKGWPDMVYICMWHAASSSVAQHLV